MTFTEDMAVRMATQPLPTSGVWWYGRCDKCAAPSLTVARHGTCDCGGDVWGRQLDARQLGELRTQLHNAQCRVVANNAKRLLGEFTALRWTVHASADGQHWQAWGRRGRRTRWLVTVRFAPELVMYSSRKGTKDATGMTTRDLAERWLADGVLTEGQVKL